MKRTMRREELRLVKTSNSRTELIAGWESSHDQRTRIPSNDRRLAFGLITYGCYLHEVSKEEERKNERD